MKTFPFNQAQLGIFYAEQSAEGNYAINFLFHYGQDVNLDKLCRAIEQVVAAHPHLMDRIVLDASGTPVFAVPEDKHYTQTIEQIPDINSVRPTLIHKRDLLHEPLFTFRVMRGTDGGHFLFDLHHVIGDGLTVGILLRDIETAYNGGQLLPEPVSAEEMNLSEQQRRLSPAYAEEMKWYSTMFSAIESESLPLKDVHLPIQSGSAKVLKKLDVTKSQIMDLIAAVGVSTSIPFTAAYAMMLRAFTGDEQVAYSTFFHGRLAKNEMRTQTMMVRTMPICHDFSRLHSVRDLLRQTSDLMFDLRQKNTVGFGEVTRMCGITGAISFIYQGTITNIGIMLEGHFYEMEDLRGQPPGLKINAQLVEKDGTFYLSQEYPTDEYSASMIGQMGDTYNHILTQMLQVDTPLGDITPCADNQLAQLDGFNHNEMDNTFAKWEGETIPSLFRRTAAQYPDNTAAVFGNHHYTYRQLDDLTDRIASAIISRLNVDPSVPEPVVSILIPRNEWMFLAPLAVMKAGCAYQPLDPSYPQERLNFMVQDAHANLVIADRSLRDILTDYQGPVFFTDEAIPSPSLPLQPIRTLTPSSLLILLYTSGSTGVPKGVMLEHRNVLAYSHFYQHRCQFTPDTHTAAYASFGFDADMMDQYPTLLSGGTLYIIPEEIRLDMIALGEFFEQNHISVAFMTTQVAQQFASTFSTIGDLRILALGGEKMMSMDLPTGYTMLNIYGPTECSVAVTTKMVHHNEPNIPIGRPTETTSLYVVDPQLHRLPVGAAGELLITGPQVGRSYLNRPDKTAEAFISFNGEHCYRTGDIVRYREDGDIEFVGRRDGQVKIRGFRIELKEVEAVIRDYQGITDATVQAYDYPEGGKYICAYIVSDHTIDIESLNQFIMDQKPPYMVPAYTLQIERIPLNVNQKVDKKALPRPDASSAEANREKVLPSTPLQTKIFHMVAEVLHHEDFGVTDLLSFVGLSSITAIKLTTQIYKTYHVELDAKSIIKTGTVQQIEIAVVDGLINLANQVNYPGSTQPHAKSSAFVDQLLSSPLGNAQLGIYYDCLKDEMATTYNVPMCIEFPESVSVNELLMAVSEVIAAHPVLSAHFEMQSGQPMLVMNEDTTPLVDTPASPLDEVKASYVRPFNLSRGPLYHAAVIEHTLLFDAHHLVMDGGSMSIFLREVCEAIEGKAPQPESYTYFDYATAEQQADSSAEEQFFDAQLTTVEDSTAIPADLKGQEDEGAIAVADYALHHERVQAFCREQGITPAAFYLAATYYLAARYTNSHDVQICTISNGRSNVQIADTVGMFVNTLPLVAHIDDCSVGEFLHRTADDFSATLSHENYPFAKIAQKYGTRAELMYEYQLGVIDDLCVHGQPVSVSTLTLEKPKFKTAIKILEIDGQVCVHILYNDVLYSADYMQRLAQSFAAVVDHMLLSVQSPLRHLSIMSPAQWEEVTRLRTTDKADLPVRLYHQGIEHYAATTPDHMALIAVDAQYTYAQLNAEMNRLAHALIARGVGKGDAVMILLPRTSHALISMFAILKSGAAFIPCDPSYPEDRIALIREDSMAKLVITEPVYAQLLSESQDTSNPNVDIQPTDLAYMIYTSGSTGRPKGVMLRHIGICSYLTAHPANRHIYAISQLVSTYLSVSTISFDLSFKEYGCCFFNGITCVFAGDDEANNPLALAELMKRTHADCINGTPSRILQYMELPEFCECLKACHVIMSGGEKYSDVLLNRLHELTKARIFNTYGPTEITVSSNVAELTLTNTISVGQPLLNYTEFVVDPDGNELPVGVVGELYIGGPGVAVGYNHLDELNAQKFITYPHAAISDLLPADFTHRPEPLRVFRSGDYARWQSDGQVVILGRADNQVKLRGLRIELGEVESAIARVEGIKQVLPLIRTIQGREHLCAYFVADHPIDIDFLKAKIGETLTHYMVPTAYLQMDAFPLTPNGKTDFKHLPEPEVAQTAGEYVAPQTQAERDFCEIFADILGVDRISATDSFFEQGGSSLTATRVLIDAKERGYEVAYADVFKYVTPRQLAAKVAPDAAELESVPEDLEVTDYDYTAINALLQSNTLDSFRSGTRLELGDVVLTGATGYLGIHILRELLDHYSNTIYVLVRASHGMTAELRLKELLFYYFEQSYADAFASGRIVIVEGDVTDSAAFDHLSSSLTFQPSADHPLTVINCAAVVKHFSNGTEIEDVNIGGVRTCIDFCLATGARFIQTSTNSTGGSVLGDAGNYSEQVHYVGQILTGSKYIHSKFIAERMVLEAIVNRGLVAKVIRLGNLSARATDGEFQINYRTNSAMGRLHVFQMLGCCSFTQMASPMEFSPIDEVARAILLLSTAPKECVIFHAFNNHMVLLGDVIDAMSRALGIDIRFVEDDVFEAAIAEAGKDPDKAQVLQSMLAYRGMSKGHGFPKYNPYTTQVLARLGFRWNVTSWDYVQRFVQVIASFDFFINHR